jgi:hypothetical protein
MCASDRPARPPPILAPLHSLKTATSLRLIGADDVPFFSAPAVPVRSLVAPPTESLRAGNGLRMIAHPIEIEPSNHVEPDRGSSRPGFFQNPRAVSEPRAKRPLLRLRRPGNLDY